MAASGLNLMLLSWALACQVIPAPAPEALNPDALRGQYSYLRETGFGFAADYLSGEDADRDGLPDAFEQELAQKYAPVIYHDRDEPNLPTNVESFLSTVELWFYDGRCNPRHKLIRSVATPDHLISSHPPCSASDDYFYSYGTRSRKKERTYYLRAVKKADQQSSADSRQWSTYFHAYSNDQRGVTIQYWRFYSYNTGELLGRRVGFTSHEGDWEGIHVVLGPKPDYHPIMVRFLGHRNISEKQWALLLTEETHPKVKSEKGGHSSTAFSKSDERRAGRFIRQETWTGGQVTWPSQARRDAAAPAVTNTCLLLNLGEKTAPMKGMEFIQYSGLWGERETGGLFSGLRSGYWGPAYNETDMRGDGFITAWCAGINNPQLNALVSGGVVIRECFPSATSR